MFSHFLWCLKGIMKAFMASIKLFEAPQRNLKIKSYVDLLSSSRIGIGMVNPYRAKCSISASLKTPDFQGVLKSEANLEPHRTSTMEIFCGHCGQSFIVDVRMGSKYISGNKTQARIELILVIIWNFQLQFKLIHSFLFPLKYKKK